MPASLLSLTAQVEAFPRFVLASLPTPLEKLTNLSRALNLNLYVKRDDQTGLPIGGNKTRKLEFIIADALAQRADAIVTWAGTQSNWRRQLAAASRRAGMEPFLVMFNRPGLPSEQDGNNATALGRDCLRKSHVGADRAGVGAGDSHKQLGAGHQLRQHTRWARCRSKTPQLTHNHCRYRYVGIPGGNHPTRARDWISHAFGIYRTAAERYWGGNRLRRLCRRRLRNAQRSDRQGH
jgi:1-aminocyclopropane-1-carboxylate deaminase/D-cysteine desulfhydrase-like pyridoxal-dependent ACC family enzyme